MPRKSMVQGYKTSNSIGTSRKTTRNGYTILKEVFSAIIPGRKENEESCPVRMITVTKLNLPKLEKSDKETGGTMLNVTGMNRFYYLRNFHDMRCKYERVLSIIHQQLNRGHRKMKFSLSCLNYTYLLI